MKLSVGVLLCVGTALAHFPTPPLFWPGEDVELGQIAEERKEFRYGREFKYIYNGQSMTGIPGTSKQHGGSRIQAEVSFVCKHEQTFIMKIEQIRVGKLNRGVKTPRHVLPMSAFDSTPLDHKQHHKLHLPVKFSLDGGIINNIVFDGLEKPWSANIKRGILNMVQVNLKKSQSRSDMDIVDAVEDQLLNTYKPAEADASFYRTMEETIEGECETVYTVTTPPMFKSSRQPIYNVTKTINFEKCIKRPQIKYNFHFSEPCPSSDSKYNDDQKFLKSSSISSYQVVKTPKLNIISNAYTESEYVFVPFNEEANAVVTYVSQNLKLVKTGPATHRVQVPMNPQKSDSDMIYNLGHEISQELFQMEGDATGLENALFHKNQNKVQIAINLLRKLVNNIREKVEEPATKHFGQLVHLCRILSKAQIEQVHNIVYQGGATPQFSVHQQKIAIDLLHDALASAGTLSAVQHIVHKIKRHEISIPKSVSAIRNLNTIPTPSKEIIQELISLAESLVAQRHYMLKQTTWLTIGTLMKGLCSNEFDQWARDYNEDVKKLCPTNLKTQYVELLSKKLHNCHKWDDQMIFVKALGNAGIDLSVFELEKIIKNRNFNYKTIIRVEAVLALRQLKNIMPKKIQKVLMPLISNPLEPETLRISAAYMILQTLPSRPVLDQLAKIAQNEHSIQVASFVHSYMDSMANSTNPCEKRLATDLKLSLRQMHTVYSRVLGTSKFKRLPLHSQHQKVGMDLDFASSFSDQSPVPNQLAATLHSNFLGFWNKYLVSFRLATEGLDKVLNSAYGKYGSLGSSDWSLEDEYENLVSSLNVLGEQARDPSSRDPKVVLSLKVKNQDTGFLPIKRHAIQSLLMYGRPSGQGSSYLVEKLRQGVAINYNKAGFADEIKFNVPTTLGMPVLVDIKVPFVLNVHGAVKMTPIQGQKLGAFQIKAALKPSIVASISVVVKTWSPIVSSGVKIVSKIKAFQPIDAKMLVDLEGHTKIAKLLFKPPTQRKDLITLESRPYTFANTQPDQPQSYQEKQKRLIVSEEGNRIRTVHNCGNCGWLGARFCIKGQYHKTPAHRPMGTPFTPLSGPNKIVISTEPSYNNPRTVAINLYGKFLKPVSSLSVSSGLFNSQLSSAKRGFLNVVSGSSSFEPRGSQELGATPLYDELMAETAAENKFPTGDAQLRHTSTKRPLVNSLRVEVETSSQRRLTADLLHVFNFDGDYHKVQAKVSCSPTPERPQPWKMCLNAETTFPTLAMIRQLSNREVIGKLHLNWGHSCQSPNFIQVVKRIEKGHHSKLHELNNPEWNVHRDSNLNHDELLKKSPIKYIFDVKYNNVPLKTKHYANEALRYLKKQCYDQTNVAEVAVHNRPQHVKVIVAIDPVTLKKCDVLIKTPKSNTLIRDLIMPSYVSPVTHKRDYIKNEKKNLAKEIRMSPSTAQCYATEYNVKTFTDKEVPWPQSSSYKVLAKDCRSNQYAVLVRQLSSYENLKEVKIETPANQIVLRPSTTQRSKTKVFVNGHDYTSQTNVVKTQAGLPILKIVKQGGHVKVEILHVGVSVYFDRKSVNVEVPPHKRHNQCGICGGRGYASLGYGSLEQRLSGLSSPYTSSLEAEILVEEAFRGVNDLKPNFESLQDFSTPRDTLEYYFGASPARTIIDQMLSEEMLQGQSPFSAYSLMEETEEYGSIGQGWSKPAERQWEINQMSDSPSFNPSTFSMDLPELDQINSEFNSFYSPAEAVEQQIEQQLFAELSPSSTFRNPGWQSTRQLLAEESEIGAELSRNPYLSNNYMVDQQSCQYMPFWQRQSSPACRDIFSSAFEMEQESEYEMQHAFKEIASESPYDPYRSEQLMEQELLAEETPFGSPLLMQDVAEEIGGFSEGLTIGAFNQELVDELQNAQPSGRQQKVVETEHSICFSKIPAQCPRNSYPSHEAQQRVPYHCMSRKNPQANKYLNEVTSGRKFIPQIASKTTSMTRLEQVPVQCQPAY